MHLGEITIFWQKKKDLQVIYLSLFSTNNLVVPDTDKKNMLFL